MSLSVLLLLAWMSQLQTVEHQTCPPAAVRAAKTLVLTDEKAGREWTMWGLEGLARRTCHG